MQSKTVITKVGSSILTRGGVIIDINLIQKLAWQIAFLKRKGHRCFHITSGAVKSDPNLSRQKDERSAIGQCRLMSFYIRAFAEYGFEVAQILLTHADISGYYIKKNGDFIFIAPKVSGLIERFMAYPDLIAIANNNDSVDNTEIDGLVDCRDNDNLAAHIALGFSVKPDLVILASDTPGVCGKDGKVIPVVKSKDYEYVRSCAVETDGCGYGKDGMDTKISACIHLAQNGINAHIVSGHESECFLRAVSGEKNFGTFFPRI